VDNRKIAVAEWLVARKSVPGLNEPAQPGQSAGNFFEPENLTASPPPDNPIAKEARASREALMAITNGYFDGITTHDGSIIIAHPGCTRVENGTTVTGRAAGPGAQGRAAPVAGVAPAGRGGPGARQTALRCGTEHPNTYRRTVVKTTVIRFRPLALLCVATLAIVVSISPLRAQSDGAPVYVAMGDSIEFGVGDDIPPFEGYVPGFGAFLASVFSLPVEVHNLGVGGARVREIQLTQLPVALQLIQGHTPIVVSWGGGGNDGAGVATSPQVNTCLRGASQSQSQSCFGRVNALLNDVEQTIDHTIADVRQAVGPEGRILMRTQYNGLARTGCQTADVVALTDATLEGFPGSLLDRGLNTRIRSIAAKYNAQVIDLYLPFRFQADTLVAADCSHPSGLGYEAILQLAELAFLAGP
jgi:lysophospholipase L1-like esterase